MAARRLILILVVLMLISTVAAALAPVEVDDGPDQEAIEQPAPSPGATGEVLAAEIDAAAEEVPVRIEVAAGTRVELTVRVAEPGEITIPRFGLLTFAVPGAPARFDLLLRDPGSAHVNFEGRAIGRIEAS